MDQDKTVFENLKKYLIIRRALYWVIFLLFVVIVPVTLLFSVGYTFDRDAKSFVKTGALSIRSVPDGAAVYIDEVMHTETTPLSVRYLLPKTYTVSLVKEGYYPYIVESVVSTSTVSEINAVLLPVIRQFNVLEEEFEVYSYFPAKKALGPKVILFASDGIYSADIKLEDTQRISANALTRKDSRAIRGILEAEDFLFFWDDRTIYKLFVSRDEKNISTFEVLYQTENTLYGVYSGIKNRYLIIHDGKKIIAFDRVNPLNAIELVELKSSKASVMYDEEQEILFFSDYDSEKKKIELYSKELRTTFLTRLEDITNEYGKTKKTL